MKKVIAALLSAVLFCLATGIALAEDKEDFPDSGVELASFDPLPDFKLPFANAQTGEVGPIKISLGSGISGYFKNLMDVGLENCVWVLSSSQYCIQALHPAVGSWEDYVDYMYFDTEGNLRFSKSISFFMYQYNWNKNSNGGSSAWNVVPTSTSLRVLVSYEPLVRAGLAIPEYAKVWEPARNDPSFAEFTFDVDITPPTPFHNLTINYIHTNGQEAAPAYSAELEEGESYSIPSPAVEGYAPDRLTVAGTMGAADVLETVIYNPDAKPPEEIDPPDPGTAGTVTVRYLFEDGSTAAPTNSQTLGPGQMFQILSPDVPGYTPSRKIIFGYTGAAELVFDVTYTQQAALPSGGISWNPNGSGGIEWNPGGGEGIEWNPNSGGGITFQPKQSGGIAFFPPKSIGAYPFDIPRRWSLWP